MAEVKSLREVFNQVTIKGVLEEKNLAQKTNSNGENYISGNLVVGYGENKKVKVSFYSKEFKKRTNDEAPLEVSKIYKGLETVMKEYVSKAEALQLGKSENEVSCVSIRGKFAPYNGTDRNGDPYYTPIIKANFVERITGEYVPEATFSVEMYIENMEKEIVDEKETGRVIMDGIVPLYGGQVMPIRFYSTTDESRGGNVGKYVLEHYEVGKTVQVNGEIQCNIEHKEYVKEGMFGSTVQTFDNIKLNYVINDGVPAPYLLTDPKNLDKKTIKAAMLYREEMLENLKNKPKETDATPSMFSNSATRATPSNNDFVEIDGLNEEDFSF